MNLGMRFQTPRENSHTSFFYKEHLKTTSIEKYSLGQQDTVERVPRKLANSINTKHILKCWISITLI